MTVAKVAPAATGGSHVYVANYITKTISQYTVGSTGGLVPLSPPTLSVAPMAPGELELTPDGHNLYISLIDGSGNGMDRLGQFSVASTGALTALPTPSIATAAGPIEIVPTPDGKFVYVDNGTAGVISQYSIGPSGSLTALTPPTVLPAGGPGELTMSPSGKFLYSAGTSISQFSIDPTTGQLAALSPATAGGGGTDMKITPDGKYLYAGGSGVSQYRIAADGQLAALSPAAAGTMPTFELEMTSTGEFLYGTGIDGTGQSQLQQFSVGANGQLKPLTPATVRTGNLAYEAVISPDDAFLYVGNASFSTPNLPDTVSQFSISAAGTLTSLSPATVPTGAGAGALAATPPTALPGPVIIPTTTSYTGSVAGTVGKAAPLSARLTATATGTPLAAMAIRMVFNGTESCVATTGANGTAACSVMPHEKAGTYPVTATFAGTPVFTPSSAAARFALIPVPSVIVVTPNVVQTVPTTVTTVTPTTAPPTTLEVSLPTGPGLPVTGTSNHGELAGLAVLLLALLGIGAVRRSASNS